MLRKKMSSQSGMAVIEMIPMVIISVIIINFSLGFFGAIHSGILQSMGTRNYMFDLLNHRTNFDFFRDGGGEENNVHYRKYGFRTGAVVRENSTSDREFQVTTRDITFIDRFVAMEEKGTSTDHRTEVLTIQPGQRYADKDGVTKIWVRPTYGICVTAKCESTE